MQLRAVDLLKFVMALAVVAIHTRAMCGIPVEWSPTHFALWSSLPFFFVTSGYLLARRFFALNSREGRAALLLNSAGRFARLYLVWLAVYIPAAVYFYSTNGEPAEADLIDYARGAVFYGESPYAWPLWYVFSMAVSLAVIYLFYRRRWKLWILLALALASALTGWLADVPFSPAFSGNSTLRFAFNLAKLLVWRTLYATSFILLAALIFSHRHRLLGRRAAFGAGAALLASGYLLHHFCLPLWQHAAGAALFILAAALPLRPCPVWLTLRRLSAGVYFLHMYALVALYAFLPQWFTPASALSVFALAAPLSIVLAAAYTAVKYRQTAKRNPAE